METYNELICFYVTVYFPGDKSCKTIHDIVNLKGGGNNLCVVAPENKDDFRNPKWEDGECKEFVLEIQYVEYASHLSPLFSSQQVDASGLLYALGETSHEFMPVWEIIKKDAEEIINKRKKVAQNTMDKRSESFFTSCEFGVPILVQAW